MVLNSQERLRNYRKDCWKYNPKTTTQ